ncbi:hypothetical protein OJ253_1519 [Cryptosporidium canis]|uniref:TAP42-like family protein n=1 Tax=Cryptosporidium canis TaxID=195482 RepID=A0A9D5HXH5_9CRYT|nr:hypothetical protein OJ253_1519 [Cryptosporidium canis]
MDSSQISERFLSFLARYYREVYDDLSEPDLEKATELNDEILDFESQVDLSSLISRNEEIEDLSTADIKYLLYSFVKAETVRFVKDHAVPKEKLERKSDLEAIREIYFQFFNDVLEVRNTVFEESLNLVDDSEIRRRYIDEKEKSQARDVRQIKIARFKRIKELKSTLSLFFKSSFNLPDEGENRDMFIKAINLFFLEATEHVTMINNEISILEFMIKNQERGPENEVGDSRISSRSMSKQAKDPAHILNVHHIAPNVRYLTSKENNNMHFMDVNRGEGMLLNSREKFYTKVLGTSHNLPTISIAEAAEMELRDALEQEKSSADARKKKEERDRILHDKEYSREEEEDEVKSRLWDDWKDLNPKGHGNTIKNRG